jgi:hypothetical protein
LGIAAEIAEEKLTMQARAVERDEIRETLRAKNLTHAQRVIQHQYEEHGLSEEFLNRWLYQYLAFLAIRSVSELDFAANGMSRREATIHDAVSRLHMADPDATDRVHNLWTKMVSTEGGSIRKFTTRIDADGKPIPIYNWINRTFAKDAKGVERARHESKEYAGYDDTDRGDYNDEAGDKPDPNYVPVTAETESVTLGNWFAVEESTFGQHRTHEQEIVAYMRWGWADEGLRSKTTPFQSAFTRLMISTLMLEMGGKPNGAEITRRLNTGDYEVPYDRFPVLRGRVPGPYPINIDERKVQRLIENYSDGLRKIVEKHARLKLEKTQRQLAEMGQSFSKNVDDPEVLTAEVEKLLGGKRKKIALVEASQ